MVEPAPIATVNLPERAYAMDTKDNLLVVGTADRQVAIFNLSNPTVIYKSLLSPLKYQTRVVSCFTTGNGFAVGSVEGRCAIQYVEDKVSFPYEVYANPRIQVLISHFDVIEIHQLQINANRSTYTPSTQSPSILNTEHSPPQDLTDPSISGTHSSLTFLITGTKTLNTD
jgi:hypothetical protein